MDYDLQRLGAREFEHLTQALAIAELGNGLKVFGDGPDGGRELSFEGPVAFPRGDRETWSGYGIVQTKYLHGATTVAQNLDKLLRAIRVELGRWKPNGLGEVRRPRIPRNYLLITNARLSAVADVGGIDRAEEALRQLANEVGIERVALWHYDTLARLLDQHKDIRHTYGGYITTGDVLQTLFEKNSDRDALRFARKLRVHSAQELVARQWLRLSESGYDAAQRLQLSETAMDLSATLTREPGGEGRHVHVLESVIEFANHRLAPSTASGNISTALIVGGPGQGKSTIAQLLCHVYRVALLDEISGGSLGPEADNALAQFQLCIRRLELSTVRNKRWPIYIDLTRFADAVAQGKVGGVVDFISTQLLFGKVSSSEIALWLESFPWLVVMDGLDEVPAAEAREAVVGAVSDFVIEANEADADVMLIATTRPQGYKNEFGTLNPISFDLEPLSRRESIDYGSRIVDLRHRNDPEMANEVKIRLREAATNKSTERLMRTPLQTTIMTYLLEKTKRAPSSRHGLFSLYYDTIYAREEAKPGELGELLQLYREDVDHIHEQTALVLHVRAESESEATLSVATLVAIVSERLQATGHDQERAQSLALALTRAATDRLVLLVGAPREQVGFEVRSLQEYMVARALTSGEPTEVLSRLKRTGPASHWRNVWLLAAGRIYAHSPHMRDGLLAVLRHLDVSPYPVAGFVGFGERLALDILDDEIAASFPNFERMLLSHGLDLLARWPSPDLRKISRALHMPARLADKQTHRLARIRIEAAVATPGNARLSGWLLLDDLRTSSTVWSEIAKSILAASFEPRAMADSNIPYPRNGRPTSIGELISLREDMSSGLSPQLLEKLHQEKYQWTTTLQTTLKRTAEETVPVQDAAVYAEELRSEEAVEFLIQALDSLSEEEVRAATWITQLLITLEERKPVGMQPEVMGAIVNRAAREAVLSSGING